ncbi:MAG TPA: hypothetical protein VF846_21010 [Thermoanaerobaculia bacterium]
MPDQDLINRIRTIFLHQRPHVTIAEGTVLLGWSRGEMSQAIAAGEVEVTSTSLGTWLWREELMAKALELWSAEVIEEALGADADGVLPEAVRLIELRVRLPRYQVAMLRHFAERDQTSVSGALARELDGVASANGDELSWAVAGFADALVWPDAEASAQLPVERRSSAASASRSSAKRHSLSCTRVQPVRRIAMRHDRCAQPPPVSCCGSWRPRAFSSAFGFSPAILSGAFAGPCGRRRPCSQLRAWRRCRRSSARTRLVIC